MRRDETIFRVNGQIVGRAMREQWMVDRGLTHALVCGLPEFPAPIEQDLTAHFDKLLEHLYFRSGKGCRQEVRAITKSKPVPIMGKRAQKGEQHVSAIVGNVYDAMFKQQVRNQMAPGGVLYRMLVDHGASPTILANRPPIITVDRGEEGPDIEMRATKTAWDVTTFSGIPSHFKRDVIGRGYERYYLLVYDSPGAVPTGYVDWSDEESEND